VAYLAFGTAQSATPPQGAEPNVHTGVANNVTNNAWTTVALPYAYESMVVVASVNYGIDLQNPPLVTRIRNATGTSFDVRVQRADGSTGSPVSPVTVHYTVAEEGVYNIDDHGVTMEAVKFRSSRVDNVSSWVGTQRDYGQSYQEPVVIGQVMSSNDDGFSAFWARGESYDVPPSSGALYVGKHIGQDSDTTRESEEIGYIVIEGGSGSVSGFSYLAGVGPNTVSGPQNGPAVTYTLIGLTSVTAAVVSGAGVNGSDGYWPVLSGSDAVTPTGLKLVAEEDKIGDLERWHTQEEVAYVVFEQVASPLRGQVTADDVPTSIAATELTLAQADAMTSQALATWSSVLDVCLLLDIDVAVADLPGDQLAIAAGTSITLDVDAAGVGWFIDPTPLDDSEFISSDPSASLFAEPASAAAERYDLLTVIAHEIGHVLGLNHADGDQLMNEMLQPGQRRLPTTAISEELLNDLAEDVSAQWNGNP
jgi:hypothetical protein